MVVQETLLNAFQIFKVELSSLEDKPPETDDHFEPLLNVQKLKMILLKVMAIFFSLEQVS